MNIYEKINGFNNGDSVTCRDCGYKFSIYDDEWYNEQTNGIICPNSQRILKSNGAIQFIN